jgi:outer membrane protein assembly factor BamB
MSGCNASGSTAAPTATPANQGRGSLYVFTFTKSASGAPTATTNALDLARGATRWQKQADGDIVGVAATSGAIYLGEVQVTQNGQGGTPNATLIALDSSGGVHWKKTLASSVIAPLAATSDTVFSATQTISASGMPSPSVIEALHASDGSLVWRAPQTGAVSGQWATLTSDTLYVVASSLSKAASGGVTFSLVALDPSNGKARWSLTLQSAPTFGSQLTVESGIIYLAEQYFESGQQQAPTSVILAVRASDGKVVWQASPPEPGAAGNVVVTAGMVCYGYQSVNGPGGGLIGLRASDGQLAWQDTVTSDVGPVNLAAADGLLYTQDSTKTPTALASTLHAYDARTGKTVFNRPFPSLPAQIVASGGTPPLIAGGVVYLTLQAVPEQASTAEAGPPGLTVVLALSAHDGSLVWDRTLNGSSGSGEVLLVAS